MLVGTDNRAIDIMRGPIQLPRGVGLLLDGGQEAVPEADSAPAIEATGDRTPGAIALWEIPPGGPCAENPEDAIEEPAMVGRGAAGGRFLGRKQRLEPLPLLVG